LLDKKVLLWGAFSADDWPLVRRIGKRALHPRLVRLTSLIVISLLALALWVAIWGAVKTLAWAVLR
jgi:hypothetical protein